MRRHLIASLSLALLFAAGCTNTEMYEDQIQTLTFRGDAAEQHAEQAVLDKQRSEHELELAQRQVRVLNEKLALAYDALREARSRPDEAQHDRMTELARSNGGGGAFEISRWGGIALESGIFFSSGRHELTPAGQQALGPLIEKLKTDEYKDYDIELAGHTDADPITRSADRYRDNHDLAALRANSVRRFLIERGVPAERVHLTAWGPNRPFGQDKPKDRRVEILLHKRTPDEALPASAPRSE
jgi:chemotaxis protein MotB